MLFTCIIKLLVLICADNNPHWHCVAIGLSLYKSDNFSFFIDHNLSWNIHIEKLCKKIASGIGALKRTRPFVPYHTLLSIFNSLVQPHFDYCSVVWGNCSKTFSTKLQKLQNRAARIINVNADLLIDRLGWKKLDSQRQIHRATMVYKSLNGLAPHYLREKFVERNTITDYALRDSEGKLAIPPPHTNFMKNSFSYSGAVLWNTLPVELRQASSLRTFRSGCKKVKLRSGVCYF